MLRVRRPSRHQALAIGLSAAIAVAGGVAVATWRAGASVSDHHQSGQACLGAATAAAQAIVRAEVSAAGVVDVQAGRVELLLYVNQYRRNTAITGEKVDQNRVVFTMVPDGSTCKVAKAEAI
jgi:Mce-associated membrane protein